MVVVKEDGLPSLHWPLVQIIDIHPCKDNLTRVVTLRMKSRHTENNSSKLKFANFKRPISKLVYLPNPTQTSL